MERMERDDFEGYVAELVDQAARDREAAEGGRAGRTGAGDPAGGRINPRPGVGGTGGGRRSGGAPRGHITAGMPLNLNSTIYDRISADEADEIMRWWKAIAGGDMQTAREATRECHRMAGGRVISRAPGDPQQVSVDELGGNLVPTQFVDEVLIALPQETPFANGQLITLFPMGSDSVEFPKVTRRPDVSGTVPEGSAYKKSNADIGTVTLFARKHGVIIPVTEEMLMGSRVDIVRVLAQLVAQELAEQRNAFVTNGSGSEEPEGVRTNDNIATVPMGTADDRARADSLIELFYSVPSRYRQNGIWLLHNTRIQQVRQLKTTDGEYIWTDGFSESPSTIMGRPVFENPDIPTNLGVGNDESEILFGDFQRGYVLGEREGVEMQQDSSGTAWEEDIVRLKWRERIDGKVRDENAFARLTGVTPRA